MKYKINIKNENHKDLDKEKEDEVNFLNGSKIYLTDSKNEDILFIKELEVISGIVDFKGVLNKEIIDEIKNAISTFLNDYLKKMESLKMISLMLKNIKNNSIEKQESIDLIFELSVENRNKIEMWMDKIFNSLFSEPIFRNGVKSKFYVKEIKKRNELILKMMNKITYDIFRRSIKFINFLDAVKKQIKKAKKSISKDEGNYSLEITDVTWYEVMENFQLFHESFKFLDRKFIKPDLVTKNSPKGNELKEMIKRNHFFTKEYIKIFLRDKEELEKELEYITNRSQKI